MLGYAANGPAPPAYVLLAGAQYMSAARNPTTDNKLDQLLAGVSRLEGRLEGIDERLPRVEEAVSELRERAAKTEDAFARLDKRNDSATRSNLQGYRQIQSDMAEAKAREPKIAAGVMEEFERFKTEVRALTSVAKQATLEAAPDVANAVAERVNETAGPDRKKTRKTVIQGAVGAGILAAVVPTVNFLTLHPRFIPQSLNVVGTALSGIAKAMSMPG